LPESLEDKKHNKLHYVIASEAKQSPVKRRSLAEKHVPFGLRLLPEGRNNMLFIKRAFDDVFNRWVGNGNVMHRQVS
jgi:hypothetical protein